MRFLLWVLVLGLLSFGFAETGSSEGIGQITAALGGSEQEIRGGVFPAVVGVLTAILVIGVAAGVVRVISRNT